MAMGDRKHNYANWSPEELQRAESTALRFLEDNAAQITGNLRIKLRCLDTLVSRMSSGKLTLEERLDFFARISEISELMKEEAEGFFELGSQPMVARTLSGVRRG